MSDDNRPTEAELAILDTLWRLGPATVREVHEVLSGSKDVGYTTTLKMMQIMAGKGLLRRDTTQRSHIYTAEADRAATQGELLRDLTMRAFSGSAGQLVMRALSEQPTSPDELAEIRALLDRLEAPEDKP